MHTPRVFGRIVGTNTKNVNLDVDEDGATVQNFLRRTAFGWRRVSELESILANMADALLFVDANGSLVRLNRAARELLSLDEASIVLGQPFDESQWNQWPEAGRAVAEAASPGPGASVGRLLPDRAPGA